MPKLSRQEVLARLRSENGLVVAEGYLFEFEQRGYLKAGAYVPEVVLEHPELVRNLHREFVHAGSDVVLAFTNYFIGIRARLPQCQYYAHRHKMQLIGREDELVQMNRKALEIARQVADETGTLMAGNLSNSTIFKPNDPEVEKEIMEMYKEQIEWAVDGGADYTLAETMGCYGEAKLALDAILKYGKGLPVVITFTQSVADFTEDLVENCRKIEEGGADVVGLNCGGGPATMLPLIQNVRQVCKGPVACLTVCYRTTPERPVFQALVDIDDADHNAFPIDLDPWLVSVTQIRNFARQAWDSGVKYLGLCCGNRAHYIRALAEEIGRSPAASRYTPDMSQHYSRNKSQKYNFARQKFEKQFNVN